MQFLWINFFGPEQGWDGWRIRDGEADRGCLAYVPSLMTPTGGHPALVQSCLKFKTTWSPSQIPTSGTIPRLHPRLPPLKEKSLMYSWFTMLCYFLQHRKVIQFYIKWTDLMNCVYHLVMSDLCNPMDCSLPVSSVGFSRTRILEWAAIPFSMESFQSSDQTHVSCIGRWILYHWATREAPYICTYIFVFIFFSILVYGTEYSSLCCTVGPCCLPIPYIIVLSY